MQQLFIHKKVLIAPLDWGLGHTTRCIPLIKYLQQIGCEVIVASHGAQLILLQQEFPGVNTAQLKGYNVYYSKFKRWLPLKILLQTPKILLRVYREHKWLQKAIRHFKIDIVISDNRYGLYTKQIPCIFITHQLQVKVANTWLESLIQKINYSYIDRYTECWIPDLKGKLNVAGLLSHPLKTPSVPVKYIGILSRFAREEDSEKKYDYLFIMSGPEPQRTIFEKAVLKILFKLSGTIIIIRGKPGEQKLPLVPDNCTVVNHFTTKQFQEVLSKSEMIISRSGYTTIMEILSLQKKSILIPTPGQTEQEYLALHLMEQQWCYCCKQDENLLSHIYKAKTFQYNFPSLDESSLHIVAEEFFNKFGIA
ncbi:MAG TPA: glycosyltransferase [Chitinophagaceae bacterium]